MQLAVAAAIRNVDSETFFGHVRIGADGVNVGLEHLVVQWDCSLDQCTPQPRIPARSPTAVPIQPYRKPCPRNQIWTDGNQLSATILPDPVNPGALPMSYLNPTCTPCLMVMTRIPFESAAPPPWKTPQGSFQLSDVTRS